MPASKRRTVCSSRSSVEVELQEFKPPAGLEPLAAATGPVASASRRSGRERGGEIDRSAFSRRLAGGEHDLQCVAGVLSAEHWRVPGGKAVEQVLDEDTSED